MQFHSSNQHSKLSKDQSQLNPTTENDVSQINSIVQMQKWIGNRSTMKYLQSKANTPNHNSPIIQRTAITNASGKGIPGTADEDKQKFLEYFRLFGHYENCVYILGKLNEISDKTDYDEEIQGIVEARIDELWDKKYVDQPQVELPNKFTYKGSLIKKSVGEPIRAWLEEQGCDLTDDSAIRAVQFAMEYSELGLSDMSGTASGGQSNTMMPKGKDYVVQYFKSDAFEKIKFAEGKLKTADSDLRKNFAEIIEIDEGHRVAIMEKIKPINTLFDLANPSEGLVKFLAENEERIKTDIGTAISGLASKGFSQGDVSIDNMGMKGEKFALFDYDKAKTGDESSVRTDLHSLERSLNHYKKK